MLPWKAAGAMLVAACTLHANAQSLTADTRLAQDWVVKARDHRGKPFAVVDKKNATITVFDAAGRVRGTSAVLLGQAPGDEIAPNVGLHAQQGFVPFHERTTPAGRFDAEPGMNDAGEPNVWLDYASAFAIHAVRPGKAQSARNIRLASHKLQDRRVSSGCVVVPAKFYAEVVQRWLSGRSVVYVLPEKGRLGDLLGSM